MNKMTLLVPITLLLFACSTPASSDSYSNPDFESMSVSIPAGFSVVEKNDRYFIRLSSPERASVGALHELNDAMSGEFDRIDLCLDDASERGDEYLSIIDGTVYDYENDNIYQL